MVEGEIGRNLTNHISREVKQVTILIREIDNNSPNRENSINHIVLIPYKPEILFHPTHIRIR